jgi:hypothetical protein
MASSSREETVRLPVIGADSKLLRVLESVCRKINRSGARKHDLIHAVREHVVQRLAKARCRSTTWPAIWV